MASALETLFNDTTITKPRVVAARQIPTLEVNYFDKTAVYQKGWKNSMDSLSKLIAGGFVISDGAGKLPTLFTDKSINYLNDELTIGRTAPQGFITPSIGFTGLQRWDKTNVYFKAGDPGTEGNAG